MLPSQTSTRALLLSASVILFAVSALGEATAQGTERLRTLLALPPEERRVLGLAARTAVERNWSWARVAERLLEPFA